MKISDKHRDAYRFRLGRSLACNFGKKCCRPGYLALLLASLFLLKGTAEGKSWFPHTVDSLKADRLETNRTKTALQFLISGIVLNENN